MKTYIDKDRAIDAICREGCNLERNGTLVVSMCEAKQFAVDTIEEVETEDVIKVVRCRDCIHRPVEVNDWYSAAPPDDNDETCPCLCEEDPYYSWIPGDNFYCAYGERKAE